MNLALRPFQAIEGPHLDQIEAPPGEIAGYLVAVEAELVEIGGLMIALPNGIRFNGPSTGEEVRDKER